MGRTAVAYSVGVLLLSLANPAAAQNEERYKVRLSVVPLDIAMQRTVAGAGAATAVLKGATLTVNGTFEGLTSAATSARAHRGVAMGVRGASFADLTVSKAQRGTISGSITLTPDQVQALKKGQIYLQVSSEQAPEGNLWGWLVR
jgi:hypothetical protein